MKLVAACIQTNVGADVEDNLARVEPLIREAANRGAKFITLPENVDLMVRGREKFLAAAQPESQNPAVAFFSRMAQETRTYILAGSIVTIPADGEKLYNRSYLFNDMGGIAARYDKIHLFDADVAEGESYRESNTVLGGNQAVTTDTPWGKIGLTVCYDLRFPYLFRTLAKAGAHIITVPAAFTYTTGKMHWHILLRARAIETGCFILAPAQCGEHDGDRRTYGHSLIIAPSGEILAEGSETTPEVIVAELVLGQVAECRRRIPSLQHDREFKMND